MIRDLAGLCSRWCAVAVVVLAGSASVSAQDAHYWSLQYGTRSSLLGGAVIGSVSDISGSFYNPGALGVTDSLGFALAAQVFEVERATLEDGAGRGIDVVATSQSVIKPSLIGGTIRPAFVGSNLLAYSLITRQQGGADVEVRVVDPPLPGSGLQFYAGEARSETRYNETWAGLSFASPFDSRRIGLGATWYLAYRTQRIRDQTFAEGLQSDGAVDAAIALQDFSFANLRTLLKLGAYYRTARLTAGVTLTTPSVRISGTGEYAAYRGLVVSDTRRVAATYQEDLSSDYRSPLSIGGGLGFQIARTTRVHVSAEWFDSLAEYNVMDVQPFEDVATGDTLLASVKDERRSVVNWAVGLEHRLSASWTGFASFSTNNSSNPEDIQLSDVSVANWNIILLSLGGDLQIGGRHLTLGFTVGFKSSDVQQLVDFLEAVAGEPIAEVGQVRSQYRSLRLLIGFEL